MRKERDFYRRKENEITVSAAPMISKPSRIAAGKERR